LSGSFDGGYQRQFTGARQADLASDNDDDGSQGSKGSKVTAETNAIWTSAMHSMEHSSEPRFSNSGLSLPD